MPSERFDSNKRGAVQFVSTTLGCLCMNEEEIGFDSRIIAMSDERYNEIERDGQSERIILERLMKRECCIADLEPLSGKLILKRDSDRHSS